MPNAAGGDSELLSALDQLFAKYFKEKDEPAKEKAAIDKFWGTYSRAMKDEDEARPKDWDGNTGSILTFTGLFAATVAAFVIESYKSLSPDSGDQTVVLLHQLLAAITNPSIDAAALSTPLEPFHAPLSAVLANALWFCSLVVALACALLATLVQQWSRDYVRDIKQRETLDESITSRALNHVYIRMGVDRYGMDEVVNLIVSLVHLAVILFAVGLLLFLFPINYAVSWCTMSALAIFGTAYLVASVLPIFDTSCPYRTPLTYPINFAYLLLARISHKHEPSKRRIPRRMFDFMSFPRFEFVWSYTSRQLLSANTESMKTLLHSTLAILGSIQNADARSASIDLLLNDSMFSYRLDHVRLLTPDAELRDVTLKMACMLLQKCYTRKELWDTDYWKLKMSDYLRVLLSTLSPNHTPTHNDAALSLSAHLSLFRLRWFLLLECEVVSHTGSTFSSTEFDSVYFSADSDSRDWRWRLLYDQRMVEHPETLLLLLNSRLYNQLEAPHPRNMDVSRYERTTTCLIPLHADGCCTKRDGPLSHIAACTVLTMVAHLLRRASITDSDDHQEIDLLYHDIPLWNHGISSTQWHRVFTMSKNECRRAPSKEFLTVLHDAELGEWFEPGGDITHLPPPNSPLHRFLDSVFDPYSTPVTFADVLRTLARHVDMSKASSAFAEESKSQPSQLPDATSLAASFEKALVPSRSLADEPPITRNVLHGTGHPYNTLPPQGEGNYGLKRVIVDRSVGDTLSKPPSQGSSQSARPLTVHHSASLGQS